MKKLLSPRGYLSWTQINLWQRSPDLYVERYIYGDKEEKNVRMDFGSKTALALENGEETDDEILNALVNLLPKYPKPEHEIRTPFKTNDGTVDLLGKIDSFDPATLRFREYKTGTTIWTPGKAQKHRQLDHYAALIWLEHKKLPPTIHLDWAQTEIWNDRVVLTGQVRTFEVKKTLADVLKYLAETAKVAREIDAVYRAEMKKMT